MSRPISPENRLKTIRKMARFGHTDTEIAFHVGVPIEEVRRLIGDVDHAARADKCRLGMVQLHDRYELTAEEVAALYRLPLAEVERVLFERWPDDPTAEEIAARAAEAREMSAEQLKEVKRGFPRARGSGSDCGDGGNLRPEPGGR
jgi:hypothetical protein